LSLNFPFQSSQLLVKSLFLSI